MYVIDINVNTLFLQIKILKILKDFHKQVHILL